MTSTFIILEQIDPPSNEPFRIIENFICSEGYRTRVLGERFATLERAQGEVEALKAALAKTLAALPTDTAPDAPEAEAGWPEAPWPASPRSNAMREGWKAFFEGRNQCPFPKDRKDLHTQFVAGWLAAKQSNETAKNDHQ